MLRPHLRRYAAVFPSKAEAYACHSLLVPFACIQGTTSSHHIPEIWITHPNIMITKTYKKVYFKYIWGRLNTAKGEGAEWTTGKLNMVVDEKCEVQSAAQAIFQKFTRASTSPLPFFFFFFS